MRRALAQPGGLTSALIAVGAVLLCSWVGAAATRDALLEWYPALEKPWFTPPNWAFPVAWTLLFGMMALASWMVWRAGGRRAAGALGLYAAHLILNALWSVAFFGARSPLMGLLVIGPLLIAIVAVMRAFRPHDARAAALLIPYLLWVGFAAALNAAIWWMN
ncbi:MAG: TspO/MBR family protein [Rubrimonas sp.]